MPVHQELGYGLGVIARAHQYEDIVPVVAGGVLTVDILCHTLENTVAVHGLLVQKLKPDIGRRVGMPCRHRLHHIAVAPGAETGGDTPEKSVVEAHYRPGAAVVGVFRRLVAAESMCVGKIAHAHKVPQQFAVGIAEAEYGLLLVADN